MNWDDPDIGEGLDPEGPSAEDLDRFGDEFKTCPACKKRIYDQVEICPHCGQAQTDQPHGAGLWIIAAAILVILGLLWWIV